MSTYEEVEKEMRKKERKEKNRFFAEDINDLLTALRGQGFSRDEAMDLLKLIIAKR